MDVAIVGGGIGGLTLALALHQRGIPCRVYEGAPEVKELGVGITLLPHGMRELTALGLGEVLARQGIENRESCFFNRFGQLIYAEPRGRAAGYPVPEVGIHRGRLHLALWHAAVTRLGAARVLADHQCVGLDQSDQRVTLHFRSAGTSAMRAPVTADVAIACDGVNSVVRRQFYPGEELHFGGINSWRGVTRGKPFLTGRSYVRVGSIQSGNLVIYPIVDDVDGQGRQLINWTAQVAQPGYDRNDWNSRAAWRISSTSTHNGRSVGWMSPTCSAAPMSSSSTPWWTRTRSIAGPSAASPCWATPRTRCTRAAPTAPPRPSSTRARSPIAWPRVATRGRAPGLRGRALGADGSSRAHQPRASARLPHPPRGGAGGRCTVRRPRPPHHPRRAPAALGRVQAHRRLRPRGRDVAPRVTVS